MLLGSMTRLNAGDNQLPIASQSTPDQVWSLLVESDSRLWSKGADNDFLVEYLVSRPGTSDELRTIGDHRPDQQIILRMGFGEVGGVHVAGSRVQIQDEKFTHEEVVPPVLVLNPVRGDRESSSKGKTGYFDVNLSGLIAEAIRPSTCTFARNSRHYERPTKTSGVCVVSLRSPSDMERWGSAWQNISFWDQGQCTYEVRRVVVGTDEEQRLVHQSPLWLKEWSAVDESGTLKQKQMVLWRHFANLRYVPKHLTQFEGRDVRTFLNNMYATADNHNATPIETRDAVEIGFGYIRIVQPLWMLESVADRTGPQLTLEAQESMSLTIDDPSMRYWRAELIVGPSELYLLHDFLRAFVLNHSQMTIDERALACDSLGDLGRPARLFMPLDEIPDRLLMEAILFSRWQYPVSVGHVNACVAALPSQPTSRESELAAIESLVRMDELNRIPRQHLDAWWTSRVNLRKGMSESRDFSLPDSNHYRAKLGESARWDTICVTSRTPSGRQFLVSRLHSNDPPAVRRAVHHCLKLRAESTVRTQRWDFMTEAECQKILALPAPPTPGKDTEGGAARPFPKEE